MDAIKPATKRLVTRANLDDYIAGFNTDDFPRYCAYYAKDVVMNISELNNKTLEGYVEWLKPLHSLVSEELIPQKIAIDVGGKYIAVDYHVQFRGLGDFKTDNFIDKFGPVYNGAGPLVQMSLWYHLNSDGFVSELEVNGFGLVKVASPESV